MTNFNTFHQDQTSVDCDKRIKYYNKQVKALWQVQTIDGTKKLQPTESTQKVLKFIQITLYRYNLAKYYQAMEIFNEAIVRGGKRSTKYPEPITNLPAWLKTASFNIIRECSRYHRRIVCLEESILEISNAYAQLSNPEDFLIVAEELRELLKALDNVTCSHR